MKLSAIIPTWNRAVFLPEELDSILSQSHKDLEIVVYDDGSTDSTPDLMQWYSAKDDRIIYLRNEVNKGIAHARNEAIKKASGEVMVMCDSDDVQMPGRFKAINKAFTKDPKLDLFYHNIFYCDEMLTIKFNQQAMPFRMDKLFENQFIPQPGLSYRKRVWEKIPYKEGLKYGEDWRFLLECGLAKMKFGRITKPLVKYRYHQGSISVTKKAEVDAADLIMKKELRKLWDGHATY